MSLSDCVKCWDTPCSCGYEYAQPSWSTARLVELRDILDRELARRAKEGDPADPPRATLSRADFETTVAIDQEEWKPYPPGRGLDANLPTDLTDPPPKGKP